MYIVIAYLKEGNLGIIDPRIILKVFVAKKSILFLVNGMNRISLAFKIQSFSQLQPSRPINIMDRISLVFKVQVFFSFTAERANYGLIVPCDHE